MSRISNKTDFFGACFFFSPPDTFSIYLFFKVFISLKNIWGGQQNSTVGGRKKKESETLCC